MAAGRGIREQDALAAAVSEAAERMSVWSRGPDDPLLLAEPPESASLLQANDIVKFSESQLATLETVVAADNATSARALLEAADRVLPMTAPDDGRSVAVPALAGLFGEEVLRGLDVQLSSSAGTAAHPDRAAAEEGAVLELVERDAVALWWHHRLVPRRLAADALLRGAAPDLAAWIAGRSRATHLLDLPTDLSATVLAAISCEPDGSFPSMGFSAARAPGEAAVSAVLEMLQGEISLRLMAGAQAMDDPPPEPPLLAFARATRVGAAPYLDGRVGDPLAGRRQPLEARPPIAMEDLAAAFADNGVSIFLADISRPEFDLACVRAVSPQLRDWAPRFGPGRLYDVPAALGLVPPGLGEEDLYREPFVI